MTTFFHANLRHSIYFCNSLSEINQTYLDSRNSIQKTLSLLDSIWNDVQKSHAWAWVNSSKDKIAAQVCHRIATTEILDLRQRLDERIEWLLSAFFAAEVLQETKCQANILLKLAFAYARNGDINLATCYYQKASELYLRVDDQACELHPFGNYSAILSVQLDLDKAIECYEKALLINREIGDRRAEGLNWGNLGNAFFYKSKYIMEFSTSNPRFSVNVGI